MTGAIRAEAPGDEAAIRRIVEAAFPTSAEADLVDRLRDDGDALISLVYEEDGGVIGHILASPMRAEGDGAAIAAAGIAPVSVVPSRQGEGIGSALVRAAIAEAAARGLTMLFLLGSPGYYGRFGFSAEDAAPFASPYAGPHFQALRLASGIMLPKAGVADYAPAFAMFEDE